MTTDRDDTIRILRAELRRRSGKVWSVTGGRGTSWGWITIMAPPARRVRSLMTDEDRIELAGLLGLDRPVHDQGEMIPASSAYRSEYVDRARGLTPARCGSPYWD